MNVLSRFALAMSLGTALLAAAPDAQEARRIHERLLTLDTHCDTPMRFGRGFDPGVRHEPHAQGSGCQDFPRMKEGGLDASFFAVFVGQGPRTDEGHAKAKAKALATLDQLEAVFRKHPDQATLALRSEDAARIAATGKRAIFLGLENGYPVGHDVDMVDAFHKRGIRYITLCHTADNDLCDSSTDRKDPEDRGLSDLGRQVVARMNRLGMMIDVSHISDRAFFDILKLTKAPVLASHSCARAVCDHPRNLSDAQLKALKANGGVVQLCILDEYVKKAPANPARDAAEKEMVARVEAMGGWEGPRAEEAEALWVAFQKAFPHAQVTVKDACDHIDHIVKVIGVDHVGIGTDFDGGGGLSDCRDVTDLWKITAELLKRGYSEKDLAKIWGGNALRVMAAVEKAAARS